jgi:hypothetical protein
MFGANNFVLGGGIALVLIAIVLVLAAFLWRDKPQQAQA